MQLLGLPSWLPWDNKPQCPPLVTPSAIAPVTILDLAASNDFWYWAAEILSHRALYLQIAVALVLVLLVLGLLNICSIQAELLLGRRKKPTESAPLPDRLAGLDTLPCLHYHKHWAEVVESKFDWRCKKLEDKWNRAAPLLTNLDGRLRRLEGEAGDSQHTNPGYPPPYSLMKRPQSPRPRNHGLDSLPSCTESMSTSAPPSATPSATPSVEAPLACVRTVERRSSSLDLREGIVQGGRGWPRPCRRGCPGPRAEQAQGQHLVLGSKDLQLKYESPSWRTCADPPLPPPSWMTELPLPLPPRPKSCPESKGLADLHQTIDESQMTIATEEEPAVGVLVGIDPPHSKYAAFSLDGVDSDNTSSLDAGGPDPDDVSRQSYQKSLHRLSRREREAERRVRSTVAPNDSLLDGDLLLGSKSPVLDELRSFRAGPGGVPGGVPGAGDTKSAYDSGCMSGESSSKG